MSALDLISKYASPGMVINAYSFMSLARISSGLNKDRHYRENMVSWNSAEKSGAMSSDGMYIERQDRLTFLKYGGGRGYPLSYGGC
ncbi:MAG: hypothetical protein K6E33_02200, partial [Lachnospiraceae bacterium]|nr:hypothetical protein [Lachnospiraceae bacterium]